MVCTVVVACSAMDQCFYKTEMDKAGNSMCYVGVFSPPTFLYAVQSIKGLIDRTSYDDSSGGCLSKTLNLHHLLYVLDYVYTLCFRLAESQRRKRRHH